GDRLNLDRPAGGLLAGDRTLEHAAERVLAREADAKRLPGAHRFARPLDELHEVEEERRLDPVRGAALGPRGGGAAGNERGGRRDRQPAPPRQKRHVTWPN